jgi:hypothetical protein
MATVMFAGISAASEGDCVAAHPVFCDGDAFGLPLNDRKTL